MALTVCNINPEHKEGKIIIDGLKFMDGIEVIL